MSHRDTRNNAIISDIGDNSIKNYTQKSASEQTQGGSAYHPGKAADNHRSDTGVKSERRRTKKRQAVKVRARNLEEGEGEEVKCKGLLVGGNGMVMGASVMRSAREADG